MQRIIFITGTDTGVGKTVLTALLAAHRRGALALKPFSSGERTDAELLAEVAGQKVALINPWHFAEPVSPWTAARSQGLAVKLPEVLRFIRQFSSRLILIEGAGGILTPLGDGFSAAEIIRELRCEVILVAVNRLGVLNQTRMALASIPSENVKVALMDHAANDASIARNYSDLVELVRPVPVVSIPYLQRFKPSADWVRNAAHSHKAPLDDLLVQKNPPDTEAEGTFSL